CFDAAGIVAVAVVIEDELHPLPAHLAVGAIRQDRGILDRYLDLVVVAVGDPAANLRRRRLARVQHDVEGMMDMVGGAALAQLLLELFASPRVGRGHGFRQVHTSNSIASYASSIPELRRRACSGPSSSSTGLVLLMWIRIFRVV